MIRVQPLEGVWQTLGTDLYPGVEPEGVTPAWGPNGPESLSFSLQRPSNRVHADLLSFTPVEWYPGTDTSSDPLWSGYTMQAPPGGYGESTSVSCVGWHYYREDMPTSALFVHEDLSAWVDTRTLTDANLVELPSRYNVTTGGEVTLGAPTATEVTNNTAAAVTLDLGSSGGASRVVVTAYRVNITGTGTDLYLRGHNDVTASFMTLGGYHDGGGALAINTALTTASTGSVVAQTFDALYRYVTIFVYRSGATYTTTSSIEDLVRLLSVKVFYDPTWESGGLSVFTADKGIKATRDRMTPLLSQDNSQIATVTFPIRHAAWINEDATARQMQEAFNDYHGYGLGVDAQRRMFFRPQPSVPRLQVDALAPGVSYRPTSTNDGSEVYNKVSVRGKSGSGADLREDHYTGEYLAQVLPPVDVAFTNPSFDASATGWSTGVARITSVFDTSPGAGFATGQTSYTGSMTGATFLKGVPYIITIRHRWSVFNYVRLQFGSATDYAETRVRPAALDTYETFSVAWIPQADVAAASVSYRIRDALPGVGYYIDSATLTGGVATILDRRRRTKSFTLNVAAATDPESMRALARAWLLAHRTVPHKATLTIGADDVVTDLQAGRVVPMGGLGRYYGEMVRVLSVSDPDTGALQSRDGVVASVQGAGPVSLALDSERRSLEALMSRMGVVQG